MDGREVFRFAVGAISEAVEGALQQSGFRSEDIDWFVPHQANKRIIDGVARKLRPRPGAGRSDARPSRQHLGRRDSVALHAAVTDWRIERGDLVMLEAMGGGSTWGGTLIRW